MLHWPWPQWAAIVTCLLALAAMCRWAWTRTRHATKGLVDRLRDYIEDLCVRIVAGISDPLVEHIHQRDIVLDRRDAECRRDRQAIHKELIDLRQTGTR